VTGNIPYTTELEKDFIAESNLSLHFEWTVWFLTVGTNLWATGLIFIRAWEHRRVLRSLSLKETSRSNANKALTFLVESGAIYLCIWILYITTSLDNPRGDHFGMDLFHIAIAQVVGMYPTIIIIVVAMQLSAVEILSHPGIEADTHIVFASPAANPQPKTGQVVQNSMSSRSISALSIAISV